MDIWGVCCHLLRRWCFVQMPVCIMPVCLWRNSRKYRWMARRLHTLVALRGSKAVLARLSSLGQNTWRKQCEREGDLSRLRALGLLAFTTSPNSPPSGIKPSTQGSMEDILNANQNIPSQPPEADDHLIMQNTFHPPPESPAPLRSSSPRFPWYLRWVHSYDYPSRTENKLCTVNIKQYRAYMPFKKIFRSGSGLSR